MPRRCGEVRPVADRFTKGVWLAVRLAVMAALVAYVVGQTNFHDVVTVGRRLAEHWGWAFLGLAAMMIQAPVGALRWRLLLKVQGIRITFLESLRLTYIGWFFNGWLPGATGGDFVKAYYIARQTHQKAEAVTVVFLDRFIGIFSLCILGGAAVLVSLGDARLRVPQAAIGAILVLVAAGATIFYSRRMRRIVRLDRLIGRLPLRSTVERVDRAIFLYRYHKVAVAMAVAYGWAAQTGSVLATWSLATGLGSHADWTHFFVNLPVIWVGWSVIPVPGGFGVAEGLAQQLFGPAILSGQGPAMTAAGAASLVLAMMLAYRLVQLIASLPGAILYLARRTNVSVRHMREALESEDVSRPRERSAMPDGLGPCPSPTASAVGSPARGLREYVGAFHVHSCYSDGSGTVREIAAAANRAGIDFFALTDHDTLQPLRDGWQGWHDGVLVIAGAEITCKRHCHVVAFGATDPAPLRWKPLRRVLFDLANQKARAFVAHSHPAHVFGWPLKAGALDEWEVPGFAGVELWSFMHDICDGLAPWRVPSFLWNWRNRSTGPCPETLAHYDAITQRRRFAAVGSLDNHAFPPVPTFWPRIIPYEDGFRTLRTHVFSEPLAGTPGDAARIVEAFSEGRAFLALDMLADARGFRFQGKAEGAPSEVLLMGDELPWNGPVDLTVRSPVPARLRLLRDGRPVAEVEGAGLEYRAAEPGVYRVEAFFEGRPWVFTNPIYLRPREDPA